MQESSCENATHFAFLCIEKYFVKKFAPKSYSLFDSERCQKVPKLKDINRGLEWAQSFVVLQNIYARVLLYENPVYIGLSLNLCNFYF